MVDEHLAVPLALDQTLAAKSIDDFCYRGVDQTLGLAQSHMHFITEAELPGFVRTTYSNSSAGNRKDSMPLSYLSIAVLGIATEPPP